MNCVADYPYPAAGHHDSPATAISRAVCNATFPCVTFFPVCSCYLAIVLVSWRFAYQRLFNDLLSNNIVIHFSRHSLKLARIVAVALQVVLFVIVLVHLLFKMKDGYLSG